MERTAISDASACMCASYKSTCLQYSSVRPSATARTVMTLSNYSNRSVLFTYRLNSNRECEFSSSISSGDTNAVSIVSPSAYFYAALPSFRTQRCLTANPIAFIMADEFGDLLDDFGRRPSILKRLLYLFLATLPVATTALLFIRLFLINTAASQVTLIIAITLSTVLLSLALHNLYFAKAARLRRFATPPSKSAFKGRMDEFKRACTVFEGKIANAALCYSVAYNNAIFMIIAPLFGCYMFSEKVGGDLNLLLSGVAAAGLALFNSNTALKAIGE